MKIRDVMDTLDARVVCGEELLNEEVETACASDMMSDVLAFSKVGTLLLTGLLNAQVLRTADMMEIRCVVFVRGKQPGPEMIELAKEYDMILLTSAHTLYVASGKLYEAGMMAR